MNIRLNLSDEQRGLLLLVFGLILLLYTVGVFSAVLSYILILISIVMIIGGFFQAQIPQRIKKFLSKKSHTKK